MLDHYVGDPVNGAVTNVVVGWDVVDVPSDCTGYCTVLTGPTPPVGCVCCVDVVGLPVAGGSVCIRVCLSVIGEDVGGVVVFVCGRTFC